LKRYLASLQARGHPVDEALLRVRSPKVAEMELDTFGLAGDGAERRQPWRHPDSTSWFALRANSEQPVWTDDLSDMLTVTQLR
jgi:hypothetical protein